MRIVRSIAYARAGLLGNPSDGYFGKTISATLKNFCARVVAYEWPDLEIILSRQDRCQFDHIDELVEDVKLNGLYGGLRLIKATVKVFAEYCRQQNTPLDRQNFALRYETDIPRQVGLAGSSAIVTATFRALLQFYGVSIPNPVLANQVLEVETREIGIAAGLQDRVCQVYEGLVFMDFSRRLFDQQGHGHYESLDCGLLPPLYVAYRRSLSQISGIYHSNLRERWDQGDARVHEAMLELAELAADGRQCLVQGDPGRFSELMDKNFDIRASLVRLDPVNVEMVRLARRLGVSAKYAGSGGAIVGVCPDEEQFQKLQGEFSRVDCEVIRPVLE